MDKLDQVKIIADNVAALMQLRDKRSQNALSKEAKIDHATISKLLAGDTLPNPTTKVIVNLAKSLGVEPWMLLVEDFPFDSLGITPQLKKISRDGYVLLRAFENCKNENVRYAILEATSQAIRKIDERASNQIADAQTHYHKDKGRA